MATDLYHKLNHLPTSHITLRVLVSLFHYENWHIPKTESSTKRVTFDSGFWFFYLTMTTDLYHNWIYDPCHLTLGVLVFYHHWASRPSGKRIRIGKLVSASWPWHLLSDYGIWHIQTTELNQKLNFNLAYGFLFDYANWPITINELYQKLNFNLLFGFLFDYGNLLIPITESLLNVWHSPVGLWFFYLTMTIYLYHKHIYKSNLHFPWQSISLWGLLALRDTYPSDTQITILHYRPIPKTRSFTKRVTFASWLLVFLFVYE